uniref:EF-hand domain-containing protein n=1 Tax=Globodera pallida TaxID=36090 RepID=A0A183CAE3_GLOPA
MLLKIGFFIFVFIKLLLLAKIDKLLDNDCCKNKFSQVYEFVDCPGPFKPNCNIFGYNCVGCTYIYSTAKYAESCPNGCEGCIKDGVSGCPENSAAKFKSIGNASSPMHESETKVDVDKNESISLNEAINHLESRLKNGTSARNLAKNVSWFAEMDSNGNNQIEPGEFDRSLI